MGTRLSLATVAAVIAASTALAAGVGGQWSAPVRISGLSNADSSSDITGPAVAVNDRGAAVAAWATDSGRVEIIQVASRPAPGARWSRPASLARVPETVEPRLHVALNARGEAAVVWQSGRGPGLDGPFTVRVAQRSRDGRWSVPHTLSTGSADYSSPDVAIDGHGDVSAIWQWNSSQRTGGRWYVRTTTRPAGGAWSKTAELAPPTRAYGDPPTIAYDAAGDATAVWSRPDEDTAGSAHGFVIETSSRPTGGQWRAREMIAHAPRDFYPPRAVAAVDARGDAVAAWESIGAAGAYTIAEAQRRGLGGSWSAPKSLSPLKRNAHDPSVAINASGHTVIAWRRSDGHHYVIQAQMGTVHGGAGLPLSISRPGIEARDPRVALDPFGRAYVVWTEWRGARSDVVAVIGGQFWGTPTTLGAADSDGAAVAAGPSGHADALWVHSDARRAFVDESDYGPR